MSKKVAIFGGTNPKTNPKWYAVAQEMGNLLVDNDFEMVWGGNAHGVLAEIHKKYQEKGAKNTLLLPEVYKDDLDSMDVDDVILIKTVADRTRAMLAKADAIIVMPGGIGTIYEFWSAVEYRRAEEFQFDIILLNYDDFFQYQIAHYGFIYNEGFMRIGFGGSPYKIDPKDLFSIATTPEDVIRLLKGGS
ncbi:MAG: LOG family protein [Firmicutes bacterium]|nr:LOG family protein [Bacillota bacterium]